MNEHLKITEAFECWWQEQHRPANEHDAYLEAWLRGALVVLTLDREQLATHYKMEAA